MVSKQPVVAKLPAEEVADEEDCGCLRRACNVSLIGGGWERYALARRLSIPFKTSDTAAGDRHCKQLRSSKGNRHEEVSVRGLESWKAAYHQTWQHLHAAVTSNIYRSLYIAKVHWLLTEELEASVQLKL
jgi:hypothetical protein